MENTLTSDDVKFLTACGIAADEENFHLEALWLNWQRANLHRDFAHCIGCGAATYQQHALDCKHGAPMIFERMRQDDLTTKQPAAQVLMDVQQMSPQEKADARQQLHDADIQACARRIAQHEAPMQLDGTCRLLLAMGLELTRENYLRLAFAGNPPEEPLDGEIEAEMPLLPRSEDDYGLTMDEIARLTLDAIAQMSDDEKATLRKWLREQMDDDDED